MKKLEIKSDLPDNTKFIAIALADIQSKVNEIVDWIEHHEKEHRDITASLANLDLWTREHVSADIHLQPVSTRHFECQPPDEEQDEIQEDTASMEEKPEAVNELEVNSDVQPIGCKHEWKISGTEPLNYFAPEALMVCPKCGAVKKSKIDPIKKEIR